MEGFELPKSRLKKIEMKNGHMYYYYDEGRNAYVIDEIESDVPGTGKNLVEELVNKIGSGMVVVAEAVIEEDTRKRLKEIGVTSFVENSDKEVTITSPAVLKTLKMAKVLSGGGVKVERMTLQRLTEKEDIEMLGDLGAMSINIYGRT
jgi:hypothetical protein